MLDNTKDDDTMERNEIEDEPKTNKRQKESKVTPLDDMEVQFQ